MRSRWLCWLGLVAWIGSILWVASLASTTFFPSDMKTFLGFPRHFLQYPYHFGVFFVLAILFWRSLPAKYVMAWTPIAFSLAGCALVSLCSETLQLYVPTRTFAIRDLAVDQLGAIFGLSVMRHFMDRFGRTVG
jgi:VanZ family protein